MVHAIAFRRELPYAYPGSLPRPRRPAAALLLVARREELNGFCARRPMNPGSLPPAR